MGVVFVSTFILSNLPIGSLVPLVQAQACEDPNIYAAEGYSWDQVGQSCEQEGGSGQTDPFCSFSGQTCDSDNIGRYASQEDYSGSDEYSTVVHCSTLYKCVGPTPPPPPPPNPIATVSVSYGNCPPDGTSWSSNDVSGGDNTGFYPTSNNPEAMGFSFYPPAGGVTVVISGNAPGYYVTVTPPSQMAFAGSELYFTLECQPQDAASDVFLGVSGPGDSNLHNTVTIAPGETATLTWDSALVTSCSGSNFSTGGSLSGSTGVTPTYSTEYTITCITTQGATISASAGVDVSNPGNPNVAVVATPSNVTSGGYSDIRWTATNATSCTPEWWSSSQATSGTVRIYNIAANTTFEKTCTNSSYSGKGQATVTVTPATPASVTLLPASQTINSGSTATLTWEGDNVNSCSGTSPAGWTGSSLTSGSKVVTPGQTGANTYTILCQSAVGGANPTASATINVNAPVACNVGPAGYTKCADEGGLCAFSGTADVAYGCNSTFNNKTSQTNSVQCDNATFGDPTPGVLKSCFYKTVVSAFNYSLSNDAPGGVITMYRNSSASSKAVNVTRTLITAPAENVTLDTSSALLNNGYGSVSYANRTAMPTSNATITLTTTPSAPIGDHVVTVTGTPLGKTTSFTVRVRDALSPVVTCAASPSTVVVGSPVTWTATVTGGTPPYSTYVWSGTNLINPANSSRITTTYSTVGAKTASVTVTDANGVQSSCIAGTVQVNFNPLFKEF